MFERFSSYYRSDHEVFVEKAEVTGPNLGADLIELFSRFGGKSFNGALYRVVRPQDLGIWRERIANSFPRYQNLVCCFGFDWLGRIFASGTMASGRQNVFMFEPGTGEVLSLKCTVAEFHDSEIIQFQDAALASAFYAKWIENKGRPPLYTECVSYKRPLFLGGSDDIGNLEICDIDVYWHLFGQLIVRCGLPK